MPCIARLLEKGTVNRSYCCPYQIYQGSTNHLKGLRPSRVAPRFTQPCSRNWLTVLSFFVDKTMQPTRSSCQHGSSKMDLGRLVGLFFGYRTRSVVCIWQSAPLEGLCNIAIQSFYISTRSSSGNVPWNAVAIVFNSQQLHFSRCSWKGRQSLAFEIHFLIPLSKFLCVHTIT